MVGRVEDPVGGGDRVVVLAEGGRDVDEAGAVLGGDEVAGEDREAARARGRRGRRPGPRSGGRPGRRRRGARRPRRSSPSTFSTSGSARIRISSLDPRPDVGDVGGDGDGDVAGQGPGRRRPDQQRLARLLAVLAEQREAHVYGGVLDVLVAERDLVRGERGAAARAVGDDLVALVEALLVPEPAQRPPDRLDVVVVEGDVGVVEVDPEADPLGQPVPLLDVLEDRLAAARR